MPEFAPQDDIKSHEISELSLPDRFSIDEWQAKTLAMDPISRGCSLANILFKHYQLEQIDPAILAQKLPATVLGAFLNLIHGDDSKFLSWLKNEELDKSNMLPVYGRWEKEGKRQFTIIAAATDQNANWKLLVVIRDKDNEFIAPELSDRKALISARSTTKSNKYFIGVLCEVNANQVSQDSKITIGASILAEPEIEKNCLVDLENGKSKIADLLRACFLKDLPDVRHREIDSFYSIERREAICVLQDKRTDPRIIVAQYLQQAGVLGKMYSNGPFSLFDSDRFREIYKNLLPLDLETVRPAIFEATDNLSEFKDLAKNLEKAKSDLWASQILNKISAGLQIPQDQDDTEAQQTILSLLTFKPVRSANSDISWHAVIELSQNSKDSEYMLSSDYQPVLLEIEVSTAKASSDKSANNFDAKLIKAFFSLDSLEQHLGLLSSETPARSVLYSPILFRIAEYFKEKFPEEASKKELTEQDAWRKIDFYSVSYLFDTKDYRTVELLVHHSLGYSWLALNVSSDGSLIFDSLDPQHQTVTLRTFLFDNSN